MIIVHVEMIGAQTGRRYTLGTMRITNDGTGTEMRGNYDAEVLRKNSNYKAARSVRIENWPRTQKTVWSLIARALNDMDYNKSSVERRRIRERKNALVNKSGNGFKAS